MPKISYILLIFAFSLTSTVSVRAQAEDGLAQKYAGNCEFIKSDFKNYIRPNDLKTRLDQGRIYEKIISDQQLIYNRLKANNQYRDNLKQVIVNQQTNLTSFKYKFESYDDILKQILAINCQSQAGSTLSLVVSARNLRAEAQSILDQQKILTKNGVATLEDVASKTESRLSEK